MGGFNALNSESGEQCLGSPAPPSGLLCPEVETITQMYSDLGLPAIWGNLFEYRLVIQGHVVKWDDCSWIPRL